MRAVFLSYARTDRARIDTLSGDLQLLGHQVWFDRELTGGVHWWEGILKAIASADVFIFVASRDAAESVACRRELEYALALGLPILPVAMDGLDRIGALPPFIESLQIVDYSHATKADAINLARALAALPPRGALPDPLPDPPPWPASPISALHHEARSDAPMSFEAQAAWLARLRAAVDAGVPIESAREALTQLMHRPDLFNIPAREADKLAAEWREAAVRKPQADPAARSKPPQEAEPSAKPPAVPQTAGPPASLVGKGTSSGTGTGTTGGSVLETQATELAPKSAAAASAPIRNPRSRFWMESLAVTALPALAFAAIVGFHVYRGFWMTDSLLSTWINTGFAGPVSGTLLLIVAAIFIAVATKLIADRQICVSAKDRWATSMVGVPLTLFIGFTVAGLRFAGTAAYFPADTIAVVLLVHLITQMCLVMFD